MYTATSCANGGIYASWFATSRSPFSALSLNRHLLPSLALSYPLYPYTSKNELTVDQAIDESDTLVGVVVSKLEPHNDGTHHAGPLRGYIAMLAVREENRGQGIATQLTRMTIDAMIAQEAEEVRFSPTHSFSPS